MRLDTDRLQQLADIFEINVKDIYDFGGFAAESAFVSKHKQNHTKTSNVNTFCQCAAFSEVKKTT